MEERKKRGINGLKRKRGREMPQVELLRNVLSLK
jgi:hypothetical protein